MPNALIHPARQALIRRLEKHKSFNDMEQTHKLIALHLLRTVPDIFHRTCNAPGHVTASGWIVNPTFTKVFLQKHKYRGIWMPSGGHVDGNPVVEKTAVMEIAQEIGPMTITPVLGVDIFDIDAHQVPANPKKDEPEHLHLDFRLLFKAYDEAPVPVSPEGIEGRWFTLEEAMKFFPAGGGRRRCWEKIVLLRDKPAAKA